MLKLTSGADHGLAARDLTIEAAQSVSSSRSFNSRAANRDVPLAQLKKLLDSRHDREVLDGLRKVVSVCRATLAVCQLLTLESR